MARNKQQGIWRSRVFTSILRALGLCALISMLALPLKSFGQLGLDSVTNFAVYAGNGVILAVSGTPVTTITGDVGLGPSGTQNFSTDFNINGTYRVDPTATYNNSYSAHFIPGGLSVQNAGFMGTVSTTVANVSATDAAAARNRILRRHYY